MATYKKQARPSVPTDVIIFLALMVLLALTVILAHLNLGPFSTPAALLIAAIKAALVVLFFMHLKFASKQTWVAAVAGLLWLGILFTLTLNDYATRTWDSRMDDIATAPRLPPPPGLHPAPIVREGNIPLPH